MWNGKKQVLLLKDMSSHPSSSKKVRVDNKVVAESNPLTDECCTFEDIFENVSTFSPEKLDSTALEELLIEEVRKRPPIYDYTLLLSFYKSNEDQSFIKRRIKGSNDVTTSMNRIADALCTKEMPVINFPKLPEIGALDGMFLYIKQRLQKLNSEKQDRLLLTFLHDITKEEQNGRE